MNLTIKQLQGKLDGLWQHGKVLPRKDVNFFQVWCHMSKRSSRHNLLCGSKLTWSTVANSWMSGKQKWMDGKSGSLAQLNNGFKIRIRKFKELLKSNELNKFS